MVYSLWFTVYGLWFTVYGLWFRVYSLRFQFTVVLFENAEVYRPIHPSLYEARMLREIVLFAMLQYHYAVIGKQWQGKVGNSLDIRQRIGRVCKDEVEPPLAAFQETECVALDESVVEGGEFVYALLYEACMVSVHLHADHLVTASAEQFQRYAASACKKVERSTAFKVNVAHHHVEDVLLGKVCSGTCLEGAWHLEMTSFI